MSSRKGVPVRTCPRCEREVQDPNVTFCPHCGVNLHVPRTVFQSTKKPSAQPSNRRINLLLALVGVAIVVCIILELRNCVASILPLDPEVGDTVRLVCDRAEWGTPWVEDDNIKLFVQVDPLGEVAGTIPCGTVVTIENIRSWRRKDYFVVPLDSQLPRGWIPSLVIEDYNLVKFEKYEE